jgi:hypothetical protein
MDARLILMRIYAYAYMCISDWHDSCNAKSRYHGRRTTGPGTIEPGVTEPEPEPNSLEPTGTNYAKYLTQLF